MRRKKRILSLAHCLYLLSSICPQVAAAGGLPDMGFTVQGTGLCEHHPQHTEECGYTDGSKKNASADRRWLITEAYRLRALHPSMVYCCFDFCAMQMLLRNSVIPRL